VGGHISRVVAGGLFALFFGLLIQALSLLGVITTASGHIFMFFCWLVGALLIVTEIIPGKPARHKVAWVILLGVGLLGVDLMAIMKGPAGATQEKAAFTPSPQPSMSVAPSQTPATPTQSPVLNPAQSPSPSPSSVTVRSRGKRPKTGESQREREEILRDLHNQSP